MKPHSITKQLLVWILVGGAVLMTGCSTTYPRLTEPNRAYQEALASTSDAGTGSDRAGEGVARVIALFEDFSAENLRANVRNVYADAFYFRDGFKEIRNLDELETYMVQSTEPLRFCTFEFEKPIQRGNDYYLRWVMKVSLNSDPEDHVEQVIGMSHFRFNDEGKVVFQQDYWDPSDVLYRRIPIAGRMINWVKSRL